MLEPEHDFAIKWFLFCSERGQRQGFGRSPETSRPKSYNSPKIPGDGPIVIIQPENSLKLNRMPVLLD